MSARVLCGTLCRGRERVWRENKGRTNRSRQTTPPIRGKELVLPPVLRLGSQQLMAYCFSPLWSCTPMGQNHHRRQDTHGVKAAEPTITTGVTRTPRVYFATSLDGYEVMSLSMIDSSPGPLRGAEENQHCLVVSAIARTPLSTPGHRVVSGSSPNPLLRRHADLPFAPGQ
jgi:hypothetical protein